MHTCFYTDSVLGATLTLGLRPTMPPAEHTWARSSPASPPFTQRRLVLVGAAPSVVLVPSSAFLSVQLPSPAYAADSVGADAAHPSRSAAPAPHVMTRADARSDNTHATIPSEAATGVLGAWLTTCGASGPPRSAARSFLRRSTNAVFSLPLSPSRRSASRSARRVPQRMIDVIPTSRRRR